LARRYYFSFASGSFGDLETRKKLENARNLLLTFANQVGESEQAKGSCCFGCDMDWWWWWWGVVDKFP
jgi:hypothetical protein